MTIVIIGHNWETCYLHEMPERKQQVLYDLQNKIDEDMIIPFIIIEVDVSDHSSAVEMFQVENISYRDDSVILSYAGGAS